MTLSLPQDMVEQARREREESLLTPIVSSIDSTIKQGMSGLQSVAQGAAEQAAPVVRLLQGGTLEIPTLDDLTPQWMRDQYEPKLAPAQPAATVQSQQQPPAAGGMPQAMPVAPQDGQQAQAAQRPMALPTGSEGGDYGPIDNSSRAAFVRTAYPYMLEAAGGDKNLAELMLAKAISENGDVGSGGDFIGNNFSGIKGEGDAGSFEADTWEDYGNGRVNIRDRFAAYSTPQVGFRAFMQFLHDNSRYAPALARYQQTGDASQLFRDIRAAGYATDPLWADKVENIRANQVAPIVRGQTGQDMPRLSLNAVPAAAPGRTAPPAPAGVSSAPPAPWENAGDGGQMMLKENDETAPMQGSAPGIEDNVEDNAIYDARDIDSGPRELIPAYDPRTADEGPRESRPQPIPPTDPTVSDPAYTQNPQAAPMVDPLDPSTITPAALPPLPNGPRMMQPAPQYRDPREGQGIIARGIDAIGQYLPSAPIVDTKPGDAGAFMGGMPNTPGKLWEWRGRVAEGAADALARGTGMDPDALVLNVEIGGVPLKMTVSELLENVTDPLLAAGWGVGDMVLDAAGKAVLRLVAPYAKGAARETIGRLINSEPVQRAAGSTLREGAEALGRGLQGVGREVAGGLMDLNPAMTPRVVGDGGPGIGRALAEAGEAVPERPVYSPEPPAGVQRRYHGTAGAFERPDPSRFDENGLYGPGYYTTSDPRVAGSYAGMRGPDDALDEIADAERQLAYHREQLAKPAEQRMVKSPSYYESKIAEQEARIAEIWASMPNGGPNVRAIDVPGDVRLLDVDAPLNPALLDQVEAVIDTLARRSPDVAERLREATQIIRDRLANGGVARTNDAVVQELFNAAERIPGMGKGLATEVLQRAGFDGIAHKGGQRVPIFDSAGRPIEHDVTVIFPDRLDRVRNAFSGEKGGAFLPGFDPSSAAMGGAAGALSEGEDGEQGDPLRTLAGMGMAGVAGRIARRKLGPGQTFALGLRPGERFDFDVKVVPLRSLITSHADNLSINPQFPRELQPRVRERAASRVQIERIMQSLDPDHLLLDSRRIDSGPMIVGPDMVVESGNGRSIALRRLANENPEGYRQYVEALRESLPDYGLADDALEGIDQPVLVRVRTTPLDPEARARFAAEANVGAQAEMSPIERAVQDAGRLSDDAVMRLDVGEGQGVDQALLAPSNDAIRRAYLASIPESERPALLDAAGNLNAQGLERLKSALLVKTYRGSAGLRLATAFVESTDPGVRNVEQGIYASLPAVSRAEAMIAAGERDAGLSIASDVATAADVYARLRRAGTSVSDYLAQGALFGERETTPVQDRILAYLHNNARSSRRIRGMLDEYARTVEMQASPDQVDMFGGEVARASKEEVLDGVLRGLGADAGAVDGPDLGRTGAGSQVVEGAGPGSAPVQGPGAGAEAGRGAGSDAGAAAGPQITPDEQLARFNAARGSQPEGPQTLRPANLPPVGDDLIPPTGGPEGTLAREGAPQPLPRPTPIPRDVLPPTGGEVGTLAQEGAPVPFARPTPVPEGAAPTTGGPEGRLRVQEDRRAAEQLMAESRGARRYDETQRRQISEAAARYAEDVRELSRQIADERAAGNTPDRLMAERAAASHRLHATMLLAEGRRGAAAKAFREYDRQAALLQRDPRRAVAQMHQRFGGQENAAAAADEYTRMVEDGATPVQLARFWAGVERGKITGADLFGLYRRFNMLSGPRTIEVNALSGALNLGYEVVSQAVGQAARGRGAEAAAEAAAPFKAMGRAFTNLAETMWHGVSAEQAARGDIPRTLSSRTDNRAARGVLTAMEMPDRFNAAVDQFYRTMTEDWAATTLAHKRARADGLTPRSDGWADAVAKHLQEIRDDVDVLPEIKAMADHVTFSEEPGGIGRGLEEFRRRAPLVANVLFPFIRTPYNIASRAVDLSPLGVVRTGAEVLTGRGRGRENLSRRVRDNAIGLAAAYWAYDQAQQGNITGAGPDDPEKQAMLRATGWQPYSIKVGDQYWSYANFAPFSLALSMGAAAHEAKQYAKPGETDTLALLGDAATRTAKVVTDMTVLQGIGAIIKSIQDPDRYGGAWLTQFVGSLVPAGSLLNTIGQATDDTVRRAERDTFANQVGQGVQARIPGLRQQVPAAQDPLGRAVPNDQQGAGALNPFRPSQERPDATIQAFLDAGIDIGKPPTSFTVDGVKIEMTPEQQRQYQRYMGEAIEKGIDRAAGASDRLRAQKLKQLLDDARASAAAKIQSDIGRSEIRSRVRERRAS